jgi:hypothetical protein
VSASPDEAEGGEVLGAGEHAMRTLATNAAPVILAGLHAEDVS